MNNEGLTARGAPGETNELRQVTPRWILNVLDAVSMAQGRTRTELVNELLGEYAKRELHRSMLVQRLGAGNPDASDMPAGAQ